MRRLPSFAVLCFLQVFMAPPASATPAFQAGGPVRLATGRTTVHGTVRDQSSLPIVGAVVVLRSTATGFERITQTDAVGAFTFQETGVGDYELVTSLAGFVPAIGAVRVPTEAPVPVVLLPGPYEEVVTVVSAARDARTRDSAGVPVTVIGGDGLRDAARETVGEALRGVAGIITRRGSEGTSAAGEQIQGIDSRQVLLLVDGQPIVGARGVKSGVVNLDRESVLRLDRIEVVKGAASAVYGSDAIGGVINLITREPRRPLELSGRVSSGDHGAVDAAGDVGGLGRRGTVFVSGGRHQRAAFDLTPTTPDTTGAKLERNDLSFHGSTSPAPSWLLKGTVTSYWNTQTGRSVGELGPEEDRVPGSAHAYGATAAWQIDPQTSAEIRTHRGQYQETATGFLLNASRTLLDPGDLFEGLTKLDASIGRGFGDRHQLRGGVEWMRDTYQGVNRIRDAGGNSASTRVGWAQYTVNPLPALTLTTGLRVDDHSTFGTAVSPKIAANIRLTPIVSARASFGRGFRAPDLGQLYYRFLNPTNLYQVIGNPLLEPERSGSWQVGVDARRGSRARLGLNLFRNDVTNLIEAASLGSIVSPAQLAEVSEAERIEPAFNVQLNRLLFLYKNVTHARTQGVELEGDLRLGDTARLGGSYTYLNAINVSTGLALTGRNPHQGMVRLDWAPPRSGVRVNVRGTFYSSWIVSRATTASGTVDTRADAFALWDATVSKSVVRGLEIFGAIDNLANSQDPNTGTLSATGSVLPIYRPEIGRTLRGGLRWSWTK